MYTRENGGILQAKTKQGTATLQVHLVCTHPILMHFLARMSFARIVLSCLPTRFSSILDHAQTLDILIRNLLLSPAPLYRIAEWVNPIDPQALGLSVSQKEAINDDRIARTLDVLSSAHARNLFSAWRYASSKTFNSILRASITTPRQSPFTAVTSHL